jgi:hypothetical protein
MQRYFLLRLCRTLTGVVTLLYSCANPVQPSGGDKDTTAPLVLSVESAIRTNHNKITVVFNENITSNGPLVTSPIFLNNDQSVSFTIQRDKLKISVPDYTKTIYLDRWLMDLNEKNQLQHKTLLLSGDSGEVHLSTTALFTYHKKTRTTLTVLWDYPREFTKPILSKKTIIFK